MDLSTFKNLVKELVSDQNALLKLSPESGGAVKNIIFDAFSKLSDEDRLTVIQLFVKNQAHCEVSLNNAEEEELDKANKLEMIRLKSWFVKMAAVVSVSAFVGFMGLLYTLDSIDSGSRLGNFVETVKKVADLLFTS